MAGQDADELFEDIGHSQDARDELERFFLGPLKLSEEEIARRKTAAEVVVSRSSEINNSFVVLIAILAIAIGLYKQLFQ